MTVSHLGDHSMTCWEIHPDCALRTAVSYLTARIEHDRARTALYRRMINADPLGDERAEAVALARDLLNETHKIDWKRASPA